MADYRSKGSLNKKGAFVAFKLVAGVQQRHNLSSALLLTQLDEPPRFFNTPPHPQQQRSQSVISMQSRSPINLTKSPSTQSAINIENAPPLKSMSHLMWDIDEMEQSKYEAIFYSLNPTLDGKLTGEQCRPVLLNSQLSQKNLAKIWDLSDYDKDGQLNKSEMCVALHLVYKCLQGGEHFQLPDRLPASLIHFIKRVKIFSFIFKRIFRMKEICLRSVDLPIQVRKHCQLQENVFFYIIFKLKSLELSMSSRTSSLASLNTGMDSNIPFKSIFEDKVYILIFY